MDLLSASFTQQRRAQRCHLPGCADRIWAIIMTVVIKEQLIFNFNEFIETNEFEEKFLLFAVDRVYAPFMSFW